MNVNEHQVRQVLRTLTGCGEVMGDHFGDIPECLRFLSDQGRLRLPVDSSRIFLIPERFPVFADIVNPRKSRLVNQLLDRRDETGFVVDSLLTGKHSVFLARLTDSRDQVMEWINCLNVRHMALKIQPCDEDILLISPLLSFVEPGEAR